MPSRSTTFRLPRLTDWQLHELAHLLGVTRTQVLIVAVDRLSQTALCNRKNGRMPSAEEERVAFEVLGQICNGTVEQRKPKKEKSK